MKLVRLTESELRQVVSESVNRILTELDWRTYANASKKAHDELRDMIKSGEAVDNPNFSKRMRQTLSLRDKAIGTSRNKFGALNDDETEFYTTVGPDDTYYASVEQDSWKSPMETDNKGKTKMRGLSKNGMVSVSPERYLGGNKEKIKVWNDFSKEVNDFNKGKSKYVKGEGWK